LRAKRIKGFASDYDYTREEMEAVELVDGAINKTSKGLTLEDVLVEWHGDPYYTPILTNDAIELTLDDPIAAKTVSRKALIWVATHMIFESESC